MTIRGQTTHTTQALHHDPAHTRCPAHVWHHHVLTYHDLTSTLARSSTLTMCASVYVYACIVCE